VIKKRNNPCIVLLYSMICSDVDKWRKNFIGGIESFIS
jgi:hypothetical protein